MQKGRGEGLSGRGPGRLRCEILASLSRQTWTFLASFFRTSPNKEVRSAPVPEAIICCTGEMAPPLAACSRIPATCRTEKEDVSGPACHCEALRAVSSRNTQLGDGTNVWIRQQVKQTRDLFIIRRVSAWRNVQVTTKTGCVCSHLKTFSSLQAERQGYGGSSDTGGGSCLARSQTASGRRCLNPPALRPHIFQIPVVT